MTNGEKYKTAHDKEIAFYDFCEKKVKGCCSKCTAYGNGKGGRLSCFLNWLYIECEEDKPETIDDVIEDMSKAVEIMRKKESEGDTLFNVSVIFDKFLNRIIAANNRVARRLRGENAASD